MRERITLSKDTISNSDIDKLIEWLKTYPRLTKGDLTVQLEKKWADYIETKYSVYVNSGSSAILLLLHALIQGEYLKNNLIVVPTLSWLTDVSSPINLGLKPILCDCNLEDLSVDLENLEKIFEEQHPSAMILVSVLGLVPKMNEVLELCKKYDVLLLEDCCESMGSKYHGQYLGSFGMASMYSLFFSHMISSIEGGFINTSDKKLYNLLLACRSHGWLRDVEDDEKKKLKDEWQIDEFDSIYTFFYPGFNLRSTDLQAFIALGQIDKLQQFAQKRNKNFQQYQKEISGNLLDIESRSNNFIASFAYPCASYARNSIVKGFEENNIEIRPLIAGSMGNQPFWQKYYGKKQSFKNADFIDKYGFYVPNHPELDREEIKLICDIINKNS